jgi:hypothetical protein
MRRLATNHGDNPLLVRCLQQFRVPRSLFLEQRPLQAALLIPLADRSDRLRSERHCPGYFGRTEPGVELQQRQPPQDHSYLLDASAQHLPQFLLVLGL